MMFGLRGLTVLLPLLYLVYYINNTCPLSGPVATSDSLVCHLTHQSYDYVIPFVDRAQQTEHYQLVRKSISPYTQALDAQYQKHLAPTVHDLSEKAGYYYKIASVHARLYFRFAALKSVELKEKSSIYANNVFIPRMVTLYHQSYNYTRTTIIPKAKELFNNSSEYVHDEVLPVVHKWCAITWWKSKDIYKYDVEPRLIVVAHLLKLDLAWTKFQEFKQTEYYQTVEKPVVVVWKYVSTVFHKLHVLLSSFQREELLTSFNSHVESKKEFLRSQFNELFNASFQLKDLKELGRRNFFDSVSHSVSHPAEESTDSDATDAEPEVYETETEIETKIETEIETETETAYETYSASSSPESPPDEDDDEGEIEYVDINDVDIDDDDVEIVTQRQTITLFTTVEDSEPTFETLSDESQSLEEFKGFVTNISNKAQQQFDDSVKELEDEVISKLSDKLKPLLQELSHTINSDYEKTHLLIADINKIKDASDNGVSEGVSHNYVSRQDVRDELERLSTKVEKQTDAAKAMISDYKTLLEDDIVKIRDKVVTILEEYFDISYTEYSKKIITETSRNSDKAWDEWSEFVALKDKILDVRDDIFTKRPTLDNFLKAMSEWDHTLYVLVNESGQYLSLLRAKANVQFQIREAEERRQEELAPKSLEENDNEEINVDDVQLNDETLGHEIEDVEVGEEVDEEVDEEEEDDEADVEDDEDDDEEYDEDDEDDEEDDEVLSNGPEIEDVSGDSTKEIEEEEDTDDEEDYRDEEKADDDEDSQ